MQSNLGDSCMRNAYYVQCSGYVVCTECATVTPLCHLCRLRLSQPGSYVAAVHDAVGSLLASVSSYHVWYVHCLEG